MTFDERLDEDDVIVLDGATGSELEKRGLQSQLPLWSASAFLTEGGRSVLQSIHEEYIRAGADIVTANTFRTNFRTMVRAGLRDKTAAWTRDAVDLVRRAVDSSRIDRRIFVAGSVAPVEDCYHPEKVPADQELRDEHRRHIDNLYEARVDLLLVETMNTIREATIAADYALQTGLPVLVSFVGGAPDRILGGELLTHAAAICQVIGVSGLLINCVEPSRLRGHLEILRPVTTLKLGAYANLLSPAADQKNHHTPEGYAREAVSWVKSFQMKLVGGCCGTGPQHIKALVEVLNAAV